MSQRRNYRIFFWFFVVLGFVLLLGNSSPVIADLGGSDVTFKQSVEYGTGMISASCYIPRNEYQTLCFQADTYTNEGEDVTSLFLKFPSDWWVSGSAPTVVSASCTGGGSFGGTVYWTGFSEGQQFILDHQRTQEAPDYCSAVYCIEVSPSETIETDVLVPWSWYSDDTVTSPPHRPCSNDGYYGYTNDPPCDETINPPATIPVCEFVPITILPEALPNALAGHFYTQQLSPTNPDPNNPDYTYTRSGTMPSDFWLYFNTGKIEWNNPTVGTYNFTAYVEGPGWSEGSRTYTIVVDPELIFTPDLLPYARQYTAYNQAITVSAGTAPYTLSLVSGTLPAGMSFTDGAFTGTPTETGTFADLVVQAVDDTGVTQTHTYTLTVLPEHLFTWTPTNPVSGQETTFTGEPGFDYYEWSYGYNPDGGCDMTLYPLTQVKMISFHGKGDHKVCLRLTDYSPTFVVLTDEQWVTVLNGPPTIDYIWSYPRPSFAGQPIEAGLYFTDYDGPGMFTCEIDWGDGTSDSVPADSNSFSCTSPYHAYDTVGNYEIYFKITDDEGEFDEATLQHQVVWLFAYEDHWLASNSLPMSLILTAFAPEGTESLQFDISVNPEHGSLDTPSFIACESHPYEPHSQYCWAGVTFTPEITDPLYVGSDSFQFTVSDNAGHTSEPVTIGLWLDENEPSTAEDSTAIVHAVEPSQFRIFGSDMNIHDYVVDQLTFYIDTPPQHGTLQFEGEPHIDEWLYDGSWNTIGARWYQLLTYTPDPGTTAATDTFTFHANDGKQDSNIATVTLTLHTPITLHVNINDDVVDGAGCDLTHCSLREAVEAAQIGDTIDFTLDLPDTITLTWEGGGELLINKNIHILGPGADQLTISAGFMDPEMNPWEGYRVFHIYNDDAPMQATISGLTIRDGRAGEGGGVFVDDYASLIMNDCVIGPNNIVAYAGGGLSADEAEVTLNNCTVVDNHGTGTYGGAGIFANDSIMTITNSTITGNVTNNFGGGILAYDDTVVTLIHSTVSGNTANQDHSEQPEGGGGGIYNDGAEVLLRNTIVAGNTDLTDPSEHAKWPDVYGVVTSLGGNLIGDETGSSGWLPSDLVGISAAPIDPLLGALGVHEPGSTPTFALLEGSPAIDAVGCAAGVTKDQRGVKRPQGIACDIGAFELENPLTYLFIPLILR
jgi:hypothetical protein